MVADMILKMCLLCLIISISLSQMGSAVLVSFMPTISAIFEGIGAVMLELVALGLAGALVFFANKEEETMMVKLCLMCIFVVAGFADMGLHWANIFPQTEGMISFIGGIGETMDSLGSTVWNIIQIAIAAFMAFF